MKRRNRFNVVRLPLLRHQHLFPDLAFSQAAPIVQTDRPTDRQTDVQ